jgi:hypothetical protein
MGEPSASPGQAAWLGWLPIPALSLASDGSTVARSLLSRIADALTQPLEPTDGGRETGITLAFPRVAAPDQL